MSRLTYFARQEYELRWARVREEMARARLDALILSQPENVYYFTGHTTILYYREPILFVLPVDGVPSIFAPLKERGNAETTTWVESIVTWGSEDPLNPITTSPSDTIASELAALGLCRARIGTELTRRRGLLPEDLAAVKERMPDASFEDATRVAETVRMIKSEAEISAIRKAVEITSEGYLRGRETLRAGTTEAEVARAIWETMIKLGADLPPYAGHLVTRGGPERNRAFGSMPLEKELQRGDLIKIDAGCRYRGYYCDISRYAAIGSPTDEQFRLYQANLAANRACVATAKPGVTLGTVYRSAHEAMADAGFGHPSLSRGELFGHSVGLEIHEYPSVHPESEFVIRPNMVFSFEPQLNAYPPDYRVSMFSLEDMVLITEDGARELSHLDRNLWQIER